MGSPRDIACSTDSTLAGTYAPLLTPFPAPGLPQAGRRTSPSHGSRGGHKAGEGSRPASTGSASLRRADKRVSFSLRERRPGPAYASPLSTGAHSTSHGPSSIPAYRQVANGKPASPASPARELFRAVQRLPAAAGASTAHANTAAASPEPQPTSHTRLLPQPHPRAHQTLSPRRQVAQPQQQLRTCTTSSHHGSGWEGDPETGTPPLDVLAAARTHLALGCASDPDNIPFSGPYPLQHPSAPLAHPSFQSPLKTLPAWPHPSSLAAPWGGMSPSRQQQVPQPSQRLMPVGTARLGPVGHGAGPNSYAVIVNSTAAQLGSSDSSQTRPTGEAGGHVQIDAHTAPVGAAVPPPAGRPAGSQGTAASGPGTAGDPNNAYDSGASFERVHSLLASLHLHSSGLASIAASGRAAAAATCVDDCCSAPPDQPPAVLTGGAGACRVPEDNASGTVRSPLAMSGKGHPETGYSVADNRADPGPDSVVQPWPFDRLLASAVLSGTDGNAGAAGQSGGVEDRGSWGPSARGAVQQARVAWLQSVHQAVEQQCQGGLGEVATLMLQLREVERERWRLAAAVAAGRLGVPVHRWRRLHELVSGSGTPLAVEAELLGQLHGRLRAKVALRALQLTAERACALRQLLDCRDGLAGPLAAAAWRCWRRAAASRVQLRQRVRASTQARQRIFVGRVLLAWQATVARRVELRALQVRLRHRLQRRALCTCLATWRYVALSRQHARAAVRQCREARVRTLLREWLRVARGLAYKAQLRARAERWRRSQLLLASLAHWRYLHVSRGLARTWEAALVRRRELQLLGRAMRVWHFYARRCRQLIRHLTAGQPGAAAAAGGLSASSGSPLPFGAALPAPLRLAAVPLLVDRLLGAAREAMLAMTDELLHLRAFLRYGAVGPPPPPTPAGAPGGQEELTGPASNTGALQVECGTEPSFAADLEGMQKPGRCSTFSLALLQPGAPAIGDVGAVGVARMGGRCSAGAAAEPGVGLPCRLSAALQSQRTGERNTGGEGGGADTRGAGGSDSPVSPRLLISGQWQHKHTVLLLLAQLRQVLSAAGALDKQLAAAERDGRSRRLALQQQAEELQGCADGCRADLAAAQARHQELQGELHTLEKEMVAIAGYLDSCKAAADDAQQRVQRAEAQLTEAEERLAAASAMTEAAAQREAGVREAAEQKAGAAAHAAAAALASQLDPAPVQAAERQARGRLLMAQRRLSEALRIKAALMAHLADVQAAAAAAPRYQAQRQALHVAEAQQQAVEAAKVVALAESEVRELTASVGSLSRAAREAEAAHAHAAHVASTAVSDAASASAATLEDAAAATHAAARAEQHARDAVSQLQLRVQVLRQAHAGELGPPPSASPLLEPLRARQVQLQGELEACGARVAAAQRELQDALEAANELPPLVEEAEVCYRAQLLQLQPVQPKLAASTAQLRARLAAYPSELVRQVQALVERHGIEACQDANGDWRVRNLPPQWERHLRPGLLAAAADPSDGGSSSSSPCTGIGGRAPSHPLVLDPFSLGLPTPSSMHQPSSSSHHTSSAPSSTSSTASISQPYNHSTTPDPQEQQVQATPTAARSLSAVPHATALGPLIHHTPPSASSQPGAPWAAPDLGNLSAAQLARIARVALGSAAARVPEARTDVSPVHSARRGGLDTVSAIPSHTRPGRPGLKRHASPSSATPAAAPLVSPMQQPHHYHDSQQQLQSSGPHVARASVGSTQHHGSSSTRSPSALEPHRKRVARALGYRPAPSHTPSANKLAGAGPSGVRPPEDVLSHGTDGATTVVSLADLAAVHMVGGGGPSPGSAGGATGRRSPLRLFERVLGRPVERGSSGSSSGSGGDGSRGCDRPGGGITQGGVQMVSAEGKQPGSAAVENVQPGCNGTGTGVAAADGAGGPTALHETPELLVLPAAAEDGGPQTAATVSGLSGRGHTTTEPLQAEAQGSGQCVEVWDGSDNSLLPNESATLTTAQACPARTGPSPALSAALSATAAAAAAAPAAGEPVAEATALHPPTLHRTTSPRTLLSGNDGSRNARMLARLQVAAFPPLSAPAPPIEVPAAAGHEHRCPNSSTTPPSASASQVGGLGGAQEQVLSVLEHLNCKAPTAGGVQTSEVAGLLSLSGALTGEAGRGRDSLDEAACLFYLKRLCRLVLQALAEYARLLRTLHAALARTAAAASARWALSRWRAALEEPQQRAAAFARAACLWRHYAAWRWRVSLKTQRRELQVVVGQWWHIRAARKALRRWWGYAACKRAKAAAKERSRRLWLRCLLRGWRRGLELQRASRARKRAADTAYGRSLARRCLRHVRALVRGRQLLCRVFGRAEELWDEYGDALSTLGEQYCRLRAAWQQLQRYAGRRRAKRAERVNQHAALAFRSSLLRVRAFMAWQEALRVAWQERRTAFVAARLLRAWRRLAHTQREDPRSRCSLRRRLRARGLNNEAAVRCRTLLRLAMAALGMTLTWPRRHYDRSLLCRSLVALRQAPLAGLQAAEGLRARSQRRRLAAVLLLWRAAAQRKARLRDASCFVRREHNRRLLRAAMGVLQCYTCRRQAKHRSLAIARLHHRHATCTRALRAVHDHVEAINNAAASLRARQLLRRCFVPWQALAAVTRANRRALEDTMAKADGMLARATQPAAVRVPLWPPAAASLLPVGGRPAREFEHAEPSCAVAQDWIPVTWGREHGDVAPPWGDTSSLQGWPALGKADTAPAQVLVVTHPSCSAEAVAQGRTGPPHVRSDDVVDSSSVSLHGLPDTSRMDTPTKMLWREYAAWELASQWRRRRVFRFAMRQWRAYVSGRKKGSRGGPRRPLQTVNRGDAASLAAGKGKGSTRLLPTAKQS